MSDFQCKFYLLDGAETLECKDGNAEYVAKIADRPFPDSLLSFVYYDVNQWEPRFHEAERSLIKFYQTRDTKCLKPVQELLDDFKDSKVTLIAHNAAFERVSFSRYLHQQYPGQYLEPGAFLSPDRWICTMVMAASLRCPRSSMTRKQTVLAGGLSSQKSCKEIRREPTICKKPSDTP